VSPTTPHPSPEVVVRPFRGGDEDRFRLVDEMAFGYTAEDEDAAVEDLVMEHDRSLVAEIAGEHVGNLSAYSLHVSVPGGASVRAGGATWVGVVPTATRRGVATALMARHLDDVAARGEPLAVLWASEQGIYGRFGYGIGCWAYPLELPTRTALHRAPHDPSVTTRFASPAEALPLLDAVFEAERSRRPGIPSRDARWWARAQHDPVARREGGSELRYLLAEDASGLRAYASFQTRGTWGEGGVFTGQVRLREVLALDAPARAALWQVLLHHDLMVSVHWWNAPCDDPILQWAPVRGAVKSLRDSLFVRLVDLPAALRARTYAGAIDVVLGVDDTLVPANAGAWRLRAGADGVATVERTDDVADLALDVRDLGATYLGSTSLVSLAAAGTVTARDERTLVTVSAAFSHAPVAWCPQVF
jgi:predicted acetyltransferase